MELSYEEQVFLRLLMRDAWYACDMRNKSDSERRLFLKIQIKFLKSFTKLLTLYFLKKV